MIIVGKETYVDLQTHDENMEFKMKNLKKVCKWYSEEEREWLLDGFWKYVAITQGAVILMACIGLSCIAIACCFAFKSQLIFKILSVVFSICAIFNCIPLTLKFTSDFCQIENGICDETEFSCLSSCVWGSGSWQTLATSFMWLSSCITTWLISPRILQGTMKKIETDEENSLGANASDSSEHVQIATVILPDKL